ncbi:MAG: TRAP transporter substrate-binding protein DctP [Sandaracinus sp.]
MQLRLALVLCAALLGAFALGPTGRAQPPASTATTTIRLATLAPRGSAPYRVLSAWGNSLREQTGGALTIHVESASDESAIVRDLQAHRIEGAAVTSVGLGTLCRPVLVLQAPGVAEDYAALDRARTALDTTLRGELSSSDLHLLGWGEAGRGRIFSTRPIQTPAELAAGHPWELPGNPILDEFLHQAHATGVPLPLAGVQGALASHQVDVVFGSATIINALQWHTHLTHVQLGSRSVLIGATVVSRSFYDGLPAAQQQALDATAAQAHTRLSRDGRTSDDHAYQTLLGRGLVEVDTSAHDAEWIRVAHDARNALVGRLYTQALLNQAWTAAGHPGTP